MPREGERVSDYILEEMVGRGTYSDVWRARHWAIPERKVAIKFFTHGVTEDHLLLEARAMTILDHPNIVRCISADPTAQTPYIVLEFVDGESLRDLIKKKGRMQDGEARPILLQILSALKYAHQHGVIHLDLKPENVLLTKSGIAKISDFGLLKPTVQLKDYLQISYEFSTDTKIAGTIAYMSPEQIEGTDVDTSSDIFSFGVLMFEILTGSLPKGAEYPTLLVPELPRVYDRVFLQCYCRRDFRKATADALIRELSIEKDDAPVSICSHCGSQLAIGAVTCEKCNGVPATPAPKTETDRSQEGNVTCYFCAESIPADSMKCPKCERALKKKCLECMEDVPAEAKRCKHCNAVFPVAERVVTHGRSRMPSKKTCPYCSKSIQSDVRTCPFCRKNVLKACTACGQFVSVVAKKCKFCEAIL